MKERDEIAELFSKKLKDFKVEVDPSVWEGVSSRLSAPQGLTRVSPKKIFITTFVAVVVVGLVWIAGPPFKEKRKGVKQAETRVPKKEKQAIIKEEKRKKTTEEGQDYFPELKEAVGLIDEKKTKKPKRPKALSDKAPEGLTTPPPTPEPKGVLSPKEEEYAPKEKKESKGPQEKEQQKTKEKGHKIEALPNVFTPNGDGNNDVFFISSEGLLDFSITILSPRNKVVFVSRDTGFVWGGLSQGQDPLPEGRYLYYLTAQDAGGNVIKRHSWLLLKRW